MRGSASPYRAMGAAELRNVRFGALCRDRLSGQRSRVGCVARRRRARSRPGATPARSETRGPSGLPRRLLAERGRHRHVRDGVQRDGASGRRLARSTTATSRPRMPRASRPSHPGTRGVPPMEHSCRCGTSTCRWSKCNHRAMSRASRAQIGSVVFVNPGSASVRRADSDFKRGRYRLYELAGAPHAAWLDGCEGPGSSFPTSAFVRAALRLLFQWAEDALPPPRAPRISVHADGPVSVARVDEYGNPLGGVRSPHLDVPLARL